MRTPKITAKRALGLTLAGALAIAGTVAVANMSQAATTQTLKLSKSTGGPTTGAVITATGKDFATAAGASKVGQVFFSTSTCVATSTPTAGTAATSVNVVSDTKIALTVPALAATNAMKGTKYNLCVDNSADTSVVGTAVYTVYSAPHINTSGYISATQGPTSGGTTVVITGENFTSKTTATIGGKALTSAKVSIGTGTDATASNGDDTITGVLPAGTAGAAALVVTSEGGSATQASALTYVASASVSPSSGNGAANNVITVTGSGFLAKTFANAALAATTSSEVVLSPGGATVTTTLPGSPVYCTNIQVVSDTELNCKLPILSGAAALGAYTVQVVDTTSATAVTTATAVSKSATYTAAPF